MNRPRPLSRNARYGLLLFAIYVVLYAAFVALSAFAPQIMARDAIGGVNLAIVSGFGLILAAFLLALLYMKLCRTDGDGEPRPEDRA